MKIATYNIRKGGSHRVHWAKMIEDHGVDLLLVQESYVHDEHLPPLHYPDARNQSVWEMVEKNGWGSAVFSSSGSVKPVAVPGFSGWVVGAKISGASWQAGVSDPLIAFSLHAPVFKGSYSKPVNKILDEIKRIGSDREIVIGGDFNLFSLGERHPSEMKDGKQLTTNKEEKAILARLGDEFGLINCWQSANPGVSLAQTFRANNSGAAFHFDGLFVPKSWKDRLQSCEVLAGEEWNRLSDHNPVVACFS